MKNALHEEFVAEIEDMLDACSGAFMSLESGGFHPESPQVKLIMRHLHSAKGGCSMFDFPKLSHGFHEIEDRLLSWVEQENIPANGGNYLLHFLDVAKSALHAGDEFFIMPAWDETPHAKPQKLPAKSEPSAPQPSTAAREQRVPDRTPTSQNIFLNSFKKSVGPEENHAKSFTGDLQAYVVSSQPDEVQGVLRVLRSTGMVVKNFNTLTKALLTIQEDHPEVLILSSCVYDYRKFSIVADLQQSKLPIPIIIIDHQFSSDRLVEQLKLGIRTVLPASPDLDVLIHKARAHARNYRSQKLMLEALSLSIYQLGVINHPGQQLIPEANLAELKQRVLALIKAKKTFTDFG